MGALIPYCFLAELNPVIQLDEYEGGVYQEALSGLTFIDDADYQLPVEGFGTVSWCSGLARLLHTSVKLLTLRK